MRLRSSCTRSSGFSSDCIEPPMKEAGQAIVQPDDVAGFELSRREGFDSTGPRAHRNHRPDREEKGLVNRFPGGLRVGPLYFLHVLSRDIIEVLLCQWTPFSCIGDRSYEPRVISPACIAA